MHKILLLPFLLLLASCANSDYFEPSALTDPGNALVYVYRPAATNPGKKPLTLSYPEVLVDDKRRGFLKYKEYLAIEVPPGKRHFRVTGLTRDARWEPKDQEYTLEVTAGESYFMRFRVEFNTAKMSLGTFRGQYLIAFHPVDEADAVYEIRHTKQADSKDTR